jgi:hypothetical protein
MYRMPLLLLLLLRLFLLLFLLLLLLLLLLKRHTPCAVREVRPHCTLLVENSTEVDRVVGV